VHAGQNDVVAFVGLCGDESKQESLMLNHPRWLYDSCTALAAAGGQLNLCNQLCNQAKCIT
jgi:hypothetical protein